MNLRQKVNNPFFFPLGSAYEFGKGFDISLKYGKVIQAPHNRGLLAQAVYNSWNEDYVEIGTHYGGSAILAALVKKEYGLEGKIYCVDPNPKKVLDNASAYGIKDFIRIIKKPSFPWPLPDKVFGCGYIDGDHRYDFPSQDWETLKTCVIKYIIFDDYSKNEIDVVKACRTAMKDWLPVHISDAYVILERLWE